MPAGLDWEKAQNLVSSILCCDWIYIENETAGNNQKSRIEIQQSKWAV